MQARNAALVLYDASVAMHEAGTPLMRRVLPAEDVRVWCHYPENDAVSPSGGGRYFYHSHTPGQRNWGEHGHFHIFLPKSAFDTHVEPKLCPAPTEAKRADVVHIVTLSVNADGIPVQWFTVNRWVTDEWLYSAGDIMKRLSAFTLEDAPGDSLVNLWLTAMVHLYRDEIGDLLVARDELLAASDPTGNDRCVEITSQVGIDLAAKLEFYLD